MLPDNVLLSEKDVNFAPPNKKKPGKDSKSLTETWLYLIVLHFFIIQREWAVILRLCVVRTSWKDNLTLLARTGRIVLVLILGVQETQIGAKLTLEDIMEEMEETGVSGTEMEDIVAHITIVCRTIPSSSEEMQLSKTQRLKKRNM